MFDSKKNIVFLFTTLLMGCSIISQAQDDQHDFKSWMTIGLSYKIHKKFGFELAEGLRLEDNSTHLNQAFTELSFDYKPLKFFKLRTGLRFIQAKKKKGIEHQFRFNSDAILQHKADRFSFKYRLRYTNKNEIGIKKEEGDEIAHSLRIRTSVNYNIKSFPIDPKLSVELFNKFEKDEGHNFDKLRVKLGSSYEFKKSGTISFYYAYERELQKEELQNTSILGVGYNFEINKRNKSQKGLKFNDSANDKE